jgi:vancomycin resistance protein YoaR
MNIEPASSPGTLCPGRGALALTVLLLLVALAAAALLSAALLAAAPPTTQRLAGFATSLRGRSGNQRRNAQLAAQSLNGKVIAPGAIFSFNRAVKSWSVDRGYVKALVSYDGELLPAYGGGVCQTSTTLYNAALLAGLPIIERHPHAFAPGYIAPGRDAAVAFPGIDLRFKNDLPFALVLRARASGDRLEVAIEGKGRRTAQVALGSEIISVTRPRRLAVPQPAAPPDSAASAAPQYRHSIGTTGYRVQTYRVFLRRGHVLRREFLADDSYPAMDRLVALTDERR